MQCPGRPANQSDSGDPSAIVWQVLEFRLAVVEAFNLVVSELDGSTHCVWKPKTLLGHFGWLGTHLTMNRAIPLPPLYNWFWSTKLIEVPQGRVVCRKGGRT